MALFEKRDKMPPHLAEIPYGFKSLWTISVSTYNLSTGTFRASDVTAVTLNGATVTESQLRKLYDYSRDGCSLSQPGSGGLYVTLTDFDSETGIYSSRVLVEQNLEVLGVLAVSGDMVDNSNPQHPVIGHDVQKLDVLQYESDQDTLETRLSEDEAAIQANADNINALSQNAIHAINVNGDAIPVSAGTAEITIDIVTSEEYEAGLAEKVDKTVAGQGNRIVQSIEESFNEETRTLTVSKNLLSLENGSAEIEESHFALAELLGIVALENIDKELFYFCPMSAVGTFDGNASIALESLYGYRPDGTMYAPTSTDRIKLVFALATDYNGYSQPGKVYVGAIGNVLGASASALTCAFHNLEQFTIYNKYNGYAAGTVVYDAILKATFQAIQNVPRPTTESNTISLDDPQYYSPIRDYSIMEDGTIWGNFEGADGAGKDYSVPRVRMELIKPGSGYDGYIDFAQESIPGQILTEPDWSANIGMWIADGLRFTSLIDLSTYFSNFGNAAERFMISNKGIIKVHYEAGGIALTPVFSKDTIQADFADTFQPIPLTSSVGYIPIFNDQNKLVSGGKTLSDFATAAQGSKADSAVQTILFTSGVDNGTIKATIDDNDQIAHVAGLGSAAYTDSTAYATAAQGEKADSSVQSATLTPGTANGTVQLSINGVPQNPISVQGINTAAFAATTDFASAEQGALADSAVQTLDISPGATPGTIQYSINGYPASIASVSGLGSAAYTAATDYATSEQGALADSALQPSDVINNLNSTDGEKPLSANQGRILEQAIRGLSSDGKPIGGFATYAEKYANASQYPDDLQPINVNDTIYIAADENHMDQPAQYRVSSIGDDGSIIYSFVRILPDSARNFTVSPIQPEEIAAGAINTTHIQNDSIIEADIADNAVALRKLSSGVQTSLDKADNALQAGLTVSGTGSVVASVTQNVDNTINVAYTNNTLNLNVSGNGSFVTEAQINGNHLELTKNGTAIQTASDNGIGNVITGAHVVGDEIIFTRGNAITSLHTSGSGNVLTDITPEGTITKGNALTSIAKTGTGNVLTGVSTTAGAVSLTTGTALTEVNINGVGEVVTNITAANGVITATKGSVDMALPAASTSQAGIVQLNDTLESTRVDQALTANAGKILNDRIATIDPTSAPLTILFDTLADVDVTGTWDAELRRIEF